MPRPVRKPRAPLPPFQTFPPEGVDWGGFRPFCTFSSKAWTLGKSDEEIIYRSLQQMDNLFCFIAIFTITTKGAFPPRAAYTKTAPAYLHIHHQLAKEAPITPAPFVKRFPGRHTNISGGILSCTASRICWMTYRWGVPGVVLTRKSSEEPTYTLLPDQAHALRS